MISTEYGFYVDINMPNVRRLRVERSGRNIMVTLYGDNNVVLYQSALPEPPLAPAEAELREALIKLDKVKDIVAPETMEWADE